MFSSFSASSLSLVCGCCRYKAFTGGKFDLCIKAMRKILYQIPLLVVDSKADREDAQELLTKCQQYILACTVETERKKVGCLGTP